MTTPTAGPGTSAAAVAYQMPTRSSHSLWTTALIRIVKEKPLGLGGGLIVVGMLFMALAASLVATHDPKGIDTLNQLEGPSWGHFFGTDQLGRDIYSRVVWGARTSLTIGFATVAIGTALAVVMGTLSAYLGGWFDMLFQRVVDAIMALPGLILIITVVAFVGPGMVNLIFILAVLVAPGSSRVVRGSVLTTQENQYVEAARALGANDLRIVMRHILPNIMAPIIIIATLGLGTIILAEAGLSFLGFGVPEPTASWGRMLSIDGRRWMQTAPWIAIFPGIAITLAVFGFNMLGDALRDVLDPRLRTQ